MAEYDARMAKRLLAMTALLILTSFAYAQNVNPTKRPRASELGIKVGILPSGPLDAITDVAGVQVGQTTIVRGENIRTGVTAILPHSGNLNREKVPGAAFVGNAFGKMAGSTQVEELGEIETPILLTNTLSAGADLSRCDLVSPKFAGETSRRQYARNSETGRSLGLVWV